MTIETLMSRINQLDGELIAQRTVIQLLIHNSPETARLLQAFDLEKYENLSMLRQLPDETLQSAVTHLRLLRDQAVGGV